MRNDGVMIFLSGGIVCRPPFIFSWINQFYLKIQYALNSLCLVKSLLISNHPPPPRQRYFVYLILHNFWLVSACFSRTRIQIRLWVMLIVMVMHCNALYVFKVMIAMCNATNFAWTVMVFNKTQCPQDSRSFKTTYSFKKCLTSRSSSLGWIPIK